MSRTLPALVALVAVAVTMSVPSPVAAMGPVIATPMLTSSNVGQGRGLECRVVNVSNKAVTVRSELIASDGTVAATGGNCTIQPGEEGCGASVVCGSPTFICRAYCRFTGASKKKIRGSIVLTPSSTGDALAALAAE